MPRAFRASLFHCLDDPGDDNAASACEYFDDGLLVVDSGRVRAAGDAAKLLPSLPPETTIEDWRGRLILPGFIDSHVHYPQLDIIASDGFKLLDWLDRYAYPEEARFADPDHAAATASWFLDALLRNGTTTALVFATVHPQSVEALFAAAEARDMRLVTGKVLMDRNCPDALADDPGSGYADSRRLIERWHGRGRLGYAITPRFAVTSSDEQLAMAGRLAAEHPDTWIHSHLAESRAEVEQVAALFPARDSYLDVYDRVGLVRAKTVFAHCLHLDDRDVTRLAGRGAAAAFCPSSNLFLGSGLFDLRRLACAGVRVGLATDVGAGTTLSMLGTIAEGYKVLHLRDQLLTAERGVYLATLGAARALRLDAAIGNFEPGKEADFVVLDPGATPATARRTQRAGGIGDILFALAFLGDDRHVEATYVAGKRARFSD